MPYPEPHNSLKLGFQIVPSEVSNSEKIKRQHSIYKYYSGLECEFKKLPAYDINNSGYSGTQLITNENNLKKRLHRWKNEPYIVEPQNWPTQIKTILNILVLILTITLAYHNWKSGDSTFFKTDNIWQFLYNIASLTSVSYVSTLSFIRLFKRTTGISPDKQNELGMKCINVNSSSN